ncbi:hypothetical protein K438DRAFT_1760544 [Mycena galopus ATCC 62051]|nr:hypothetical protein K438DRAFT_1787931 [Mycena galopus ATCC 62051]KAF8196396.1 hypothetical protein K438DRAFT_1760544 [Mycena galopus ATCC 62051]
MHTLQLVAVSQSPCHSPSPEQRRLGCTTKNYNPVPAKQPMGKKKIAIPSLERLKEYRRIATVGMEPGMVALGREYHAEPRREMDHPSSRSNWQIVEETGIQASGLQHQQCCSTRVLEACKGQSVAKLSKQQKPTRSERDGALQGLRSVSVNIFTSHGIQHLGGYKSGSAIIGCSYETMRGGTTKWIRFFSQEEEMARCLAAPAQGLGGLPLLVPRYCSQRDTKRVRVRQTMPVVVCW